MKGLKETAEMMTREDYKERFKAEYFQVVIRFKKLCSMLNAWDNGTLDFEPVCTKAIYNLQVKAMSEYIAALEIRAQIEGIELEEVAE